MSLTTLSVVLWHKIKCSKLFNSYHYSQINALFLGFRNIRCKYGLFSKFTSFITTLEWFWRIRKRKFKFKYAMGKNYTNRIFKIKKTIL